MNKHILSAMLIAVITTLSLLPAAPILPRAHAQGSPSLYIADSLGFTVFAGNPNDTFTVNVFISSVSNLVGYDITLRYDQLALTATNVVFTGTTVFCLADINTVIPCRDSLVAAQVFQDSTGTVRSARSLKGGVTMNVDASTGDLPALTVTFKSLIRESALIHIATDAECACSGIAVIMGGQSVGIPHTTADANFFTEPNIDFQNGFNGTVTKITVKISEGITSVTLVAPLTLKREETLPGFAFVVFDVIDPHGGDTPVVSNTVVLVPGNIKTVTGTFSFKASCADSCGFYLILATLWRGSVSQAIVSFESVTGHHFQVLA